MLIDLSIKDFAIIEELSLTFSQGLNVMSGETGAGKSIIINAVNLILGDRAMSDLIRTGAQEAVVEAMFRLPEPNPLSTMLKEKGIGRTNEGLIVRRVISREGKNRIFLNGSRITLSALSEVGEELINISGQHEHQTLLKPDRHIDIIDAYMGLYPKRSEVAESVKKLKGLIDELDLITTDEEEKARREDFLNFQVKEIEEAKLTVGEDEELKKERGLLQNAEKLFKNAQGAHDTLYSMGGSTQETISSAIEKIKELVEIDKDLKSLLELLMGALYSVEDVSKELKGYASKVLFNPDRLEEVQERLRLIESLKKKYGLSIDDILTYQEKAKGELKTLESNEERMAWLKGEIVKAREETLALCLELSEMRREAADKFSKAIEEEVTSLGMTGTRFVVGLKRLEAAPDNAMSVGGYLAGPRGIDRVEFFISPNVGEKPRALARIASGGELSRLLLAMKKTLAQTQVIPTLVFDEVDSGIGGAIAQVVGKKLKEVSTHQQVICITHLPQIAGYADTHYSVVKDTRGERTKTRVERLSQDERVMEVARMLGGETLTETSIRHAKEMIESSR